MVTGNTPLPTNHLPPLRIKNKDIVFERTMIGTVTSESRSMLLMFHWDEYMTKL